jgi:hypothetical protein
LLWVGGWCWMVVEDIRNDRSSFIQLSWLVKISQSLSIQTIQHCY